MQAIILAGGKGTRLRPFTTNIPKPLIPINDLPILEIVLRQLKYYGFRDIVLAVNHLSDLFMAFFKNGEKLDMNISYSVEDKLLGTAGPLSLMENLDEDFLVLNGDLLSTIDFKKLFMFHKKKKAMATVASYRKEVKIDLGVLKMSGDRFEDYIEKPVYNFEVSMGIYVFNKKVLNYIPKDKKMDMPELILKLRDKKQRVKCYRGKYFWLDIGQVDDYETANNIFNDRKKEFLKGAGNI